MYSRVPKPDITHNIRKETLTYEIDKIENKSNHMTTAKRKPRGS